MVISNILYGTGLDATATAEQHLSTLEKCTTKSIKNVSLLVIRNWEGYDSAYPVCSQLRSADVPRYTWIDLVKLCFARLSASCLNVDSSSKPFPSSQKVLVLSKDGQHICCAHDLHAVWFPYCIGQHYCNSSRSQYSWNFAILWLGMLQYFDWNVAILQHEMNGAILWLVECCNMTMSQYDNLEVWQMTAHKVISHKITTL